MLIELLSDKIQFLEEAGDWKEAIKKSAQPLLADGSIEESYIDAMIQMCQKYNAYIVLADRFAMPHASSENGVNKMGVTLSIIKKPVDFFGKPVQILLTLASNDSQSHLSLLQEVANVLGNPFIIEQLISAERIADVSNIIVAIKNQECGKITEF